MTSLARRCDLIVALIDALLDEGEASPPNDTCGPAFEFPGRSHSGPPGGEPEFEENGVASGGPVQAA